MNTEMTVGFGINPEVSAKYAPGDEQKLPADITMEIAGTSVNVAFNLRQLGYLVDLIGTVGENCPYKDFLTGALVERGVNHVLLPCKKKTSIAVVTLPTNGTMPQILSDKSEYLWTPIDEVRKAVRRSKPEYVMATGVIPEEAELVLAMFDSAGRAVKVLNPRHSLIVQPELFNLLLQQTDILAVNQYEFLGFSSNGHVTFADMAKLHLLGPDLVLVTRDARGAMLTRKDHTRIDQPVVETGPMVDEIGAGDCFLSYFVHALHQGKDLVWAMKLAALAAGIKVTKVGGSNVPTRQEVEQNLHLIS